MLPVLALAASFASETLAPFADAAGPLGGIHTVAALHTDLSPRPTPVLRAWDAADGSLGSPVGRDVVLADEGGLWWLGGMEVAGHGHAWLARVGADGLPLWAQRYELPGDLAPRQVVAAPDGGAFVIGDLVQAGGSDVGVLRVDASGAPMWVQRYAHGAGWRERARHAVLTSDGGLLVVGDLARGDGETEARLGLVFAVDAQGQVAWAQGLDRLPYEHESLTRALQLDDGGFVLLGRSFHDATWSVDRGWVVRLDAYGGAMWERALGSASGDVNLVDVTEGEDGGLTLAGSFRPDDWRPFVARLSAEGEDRGALAIEPAVGGGGRTLGLLASDEGAQPTLLWAAGGSQPQIIATNLSASGGSSRALLPIPAPKAWSAQAGPGGAIRLAVLLEGGRVVALRSAPEAEGPAAVRPLQLDTDRGTPFARESGLQVTAGFAEAVSASPPRLVAVSCREGACGTL